MVIDQNEWYEEMFYDGKSSSNSSGLADSWQDQNGGYSKSGLKDHCGRRQDMERTKKDLNNLEKNKDDILGSETIKNRWWIKDRTNVHRMKKTTDQGDLDSDGNPIGSPRGKA
jgi:hypothetical protein